MNELTTHEAHRIETMLRTGAYRDDPRPVYQTLREKAPVYRSQAWNGWLVTRHTDVEAVLNRPELFSASGRLFKAIEQLEPAQRLRVEPLIAQFSAGLQHSDPPEHTRIHKLVHRGLAPAVVNRMQDRIQSFIDDLLEPALATGRLDLVEDFAEPLPVRVLGDLLGFTTEECEQFRRWDDDHVALFGNRAGQPEIVERAQRSLNEQIAWLERVADRRRREPRDDLFGTLLDGLDSGALRDLPELLGSYLAILIGGHETTTGLISSAVMLLDRHPKQLGRLRADLSILPQAIEESLRYESPLQIVSRVAATDASIGSTAIKKGDLVLTIVGAANHDGEVFEDPGRFDVTRRPNRHLAFGAGVHFCIGAQLARLEARLALTTLLQRVPRFRVVADRIEWRDNDFFRVLKTLPIEFEAST